MPRRGYWRKKSERKQGLKESERTGVISVRPKKPVFLSPQGPLLTSDQPPEKSPNIKNENLDPTIPVAKVCSKNPAFSKSYTDTISSSLIPNTRTQKTRLTFGKPEE